MRERPKEWEVVCPKCLAGMVWSDALVSQRLGKYGDRWPKHCGRTMMLREVISEQLRQRMKNPYCDQGSCQMANYGSCSCACEGKFHGVNNPSPQFDKIKLKPISWYRQPIREYLPQ